MDLAEKIERLNSLCDGSLSIGHYHQWYVTSYRLGSAMHDGQGEWADTVEEAVDKALVRVEKYVRQMSLVEAILF